MDVDTDASAPVADPRFRLAVGAYVGVLLAGAMTVAVVLAGSSPAGLATVGGVALAGGLAIGVGLADRLDNLPTRLGRNRRRRAGLVAPAAAFGAVGFGPVATAMAPRTTVAGLATALAVVLSGWIVGTMARTRFVDAIAETEPALTVPWTPPGSARADLALLGLALIVGLSGAFGGNWSTATVWTGLAALWAVSCVVEGRWRIGDGGQTPAIQVHEAGLVKRLPYSKSVVPWSDVRHVRLRDGELVLDRGLFEVRFEGDQLGDPQAVLASIERTSSTAVVW